MIHDFHHVPGRLRVRTTRLKGDHRYASTVRGELYGLAGVRDVRFNELTGSVIVTYDQDRISLDQLTAKLADLGLVLPAARAGRPATSQLAERVGQVLVGLTLEALIGRSAATLLVSLL